MLRSLKWKFVLYAAISLFAILLLLPTLTSELPQWWTKIFPSEKIHLGLDLQGGMHLILEVESEKAVESYVERIKNNLKDDLKDRGIPAGKVEREKKDQIILEVSGEKGKWEKLLSERYSIMQELSSSEIGGGIWRIGLVLDSKQADHIKKNAIDQALETIRNRIDQFGVSEPEITLQGTDRILIQLPGIKDPHRAINLIGRTALLEFKLVDEEGDIEAALKGNIPEGDIILYQRSVDPKTGGVKKIPYLLKEKTLMTGEVLKDARVSLDSQFHEPYVALEFDDIGAKLFEQITGANVKKRLAIILDNNVYSAPVIQERIAGGRAQITGRFDTKEAGDLAIVLRAGALPAPVKIIEERTVGPSLGQDSIQKGMISTLISAVLVVFFMIFYYRVSGIIADVALILNIVLTLATLAIFRATLTLPGIAGLVLSVGMAVDANILIHERIKEELRWGKTPRAAIDQGYHRAFVTIIDSNLTTLIAGVLLYQFGTGPVRGFAVTVCIGILANIFTAVYITRWIFDFITLKLGVKRLSI
ncbi:MAG: protein translocase subunit SecD [Deltaproteobacteria bacterium CG_4_8_14_3_um_filter_45_9]|nr:MAG: protein translocase subunit SecD [Deltaproteobacteria bacterium CG03_land_8_20_14_0_80_45_14]PIX22894.1 MAG: protein translocase subunit SecD [Deltaproteobacteria bacterium CG_4_8_14_3_um_filter_45_9]